MDQSKISFIQNISVPGGPPNAFAFVVYCLGRDNNYSEVLIYFLEGFMFRSYYYSLCRFAGRTSPDSLDTYCLIQELSQTEAPEEGHVRQPGAVFPWGGFGGVDCACISWLAARLAEQVDSQNTGVHPQGLSRVCRDCS